MPVTGHCILTAGPAAIRIHRSAAATTDQQKFSNLYVRQKSTRDGQTLIEI